MHFTRNLQYFRTYQTAEKVLAKSELSRGRKKKIIQTRKDLCGLTRDHVLRTERWD